MKDWQSFCQAISIAAKGNTGEHINQRNGGKLSNQPQAKIMWANIFQNASEGLSWTENILKLSCHTTMFISIYSRTFKASTTGLRLKMCKSFWIGQFYTRVKKWWQDLTKQWAKLIIDCLLITLLLKSLTKRRHLSFLPMSCIWRPVHLSQPRH